MLREHIFWDGQNVYQQNIKNLWRNLIAKYEMRESNFVLRIQRYQAELHLVPTLT